MTMFFQFQTQEERKEAFGGDCIELQICRLPVGTPEEECVQNDALVHWQNDSLYVGDENAFMREYGEILRDGIYQNLQRGTVDPYGCNYYAPEKVSEIRERLSRQKPQGYEVFLRWLKESEKENGFYVLGI